MLFRATPKRLTARDCVIVLQEHMVFGFVPEHVPLVLNKLQAIQLSI
jgi:hypothetical protein